MTADIKLNNENEVGAVLPDLQDLKARAEVAINGLEKQAQPSATPAANAAPSVSASASVPQSKFTDTGGMLAKIALSVLVPEPVTQALLIGGAALLEASADKKKNASAPTARKSNSLFISTTRAPGYAAQTSTRSMFVDKKSTSTSSFKKQASDDLYAKASITSQSLTGVSTTATPAFVSTGVKVPPRAAANLNEGIVSELKQTLGLINKAIKGPMSDARLADGLKKGLDNAEQYAMQNLDKQNVIKVVQRVYKPA